MDKVEEAKLLLDRLQHSIFEAGRAWSIFKAIFIIPDTDHWILRQESWDAHYDSAELNTLANSLLFSSASTICAMSQHNWKHKRKGKLITSITFTRVLEILKIDFNTKNSAIPVTIEWNEIQPTLNQVRRLRDQRIAHMDDQWFDAANPGKLILKHVPDSIIGLGKVWASLQRVVSDEPNTTWGYFTEGNCGEGIYHALWSDVKIEEWKLRYIKILPIDSKDKCNVLNQILKEMLEWRPPQTDPFGVHSH